MGEWWPLACYSQWGTCKSITNNGNTAKSCHQWRMKHNTFVSVISYFYEFIPNKITTYEKL